MADPIFRARPYSQFNFLVDLGAGTGTDQPQAGFQEVSGLGMEITIAEYRAGNSKDNAHIKINGGYKVPDVTLKRGLIGAPDLYQWLEVVRNGGNDTTALRTVTISLQSEDHTQTVMSWKLTNARPMKYTGPSLNGKGTDLAIEELVLSCERIDMAGATS